MKCSHCGEAIQVSDVTCSFCNFNFRTGEPGHLSPPPQEEVRDATRKCIAGAISGVPLFLLGGLMLSMGIGTAKAKWPLILSLAPLGVAGQQWELRSRLLKRTRLAEASQARRSGAT